jgi:serine/threonine protein kinase
MNTRLQHRLTEPEILTIFAHVSEGVATMHYLKPPLLHRDLKVENVLISKSASGAITYKLCDFGSAAQPRPAATNATEGRLIEEDIQKHTTMQYRSPEMVDVWRRLPIDEKSDIWALGVFLYKLCYYTTPFEHVGQMAILNASYKYPQYPVFSDRLKRFIGVFSAILPTHVLPTNRSCSMDVKGGSKPEAKHLPGRQGSLFYARHSRSHQRHLLGPHALRCSFDPAVTFYHPYHISSTSRYQPCCSCRAETIHSRDSPHEKGPSPITGSSCRKGEPFAFSWGPLCCP